MKTKLLNNEELEWSAVVANNSMNRERNAFGVNSYEKEIHFNPVDFLRKRKHQAAIQWTDLCCGTGNALIQTADYFKDDALAKKLSITGIDLVDYFSSYEKNSILELQQMNLSNWQATQKSDLITIIHGLHYIGDKIELILKAAAALKSDGLLVGNLDLSNIKIKGIAQPEKWLSSFFKKNEVLYDQRKKLICIEGNRMIDSPFLYEGADDKAGPNYTGQAVVNSFYILKTDQ